MEKVEQNLLTVCSELLNTLRETPENKKCFDCSDTNSPRYVCTNFCTFVCSCCANIHKEFGHQIQCLSVFSFNLSEILLLKDTGNKVAADKWLVRWTPMDMKEPDPTSPVYKETAREYIRAKYIEKRWAKQLPRVDYPPYQLHDDKLGMPPAVATNFHAANPFMFPYVAPASRMSYPPQLGYQLYPHVMADMNAYYQMALPYYQRSMDPRANHVYINPFDDTPHTNKELLRSRTTTDLVRDRSNSFPPTDSAVIIRSASAQSVICPQILPQILQQPPAVTTTVVVDDSKRIPDKPVSSSNEEGEVGAAKGKVMGLVSKMTGFINSKRNPHKMSV